MHAETQLVVGALAVIRRAKQLGCTRHPWLVKLMERRSAKVAAVALANKMARIALAMMARGEPSSSAAGRATQPTTSLPSGAVKRAGQR